jgi:hypothetical protein
VSQFARTNSLGSTVSTAELEAPNRALDHFTAAVSGTGNAKDTEYQNTGATARLVTIVLTGSGGARAAIDFGDASPPATRDVDTGAVAFTTPVVLPFRVRPGQYYKLVTVAGTITVQKWAEWQL